ncbi:hypothetical protein [Nonomuraea sp. NPDC050643]|uniref:WD40 repeat domain-containing protein n=1 Tax=Nonomuraea sp. NPDC050643 TaxID=3155660 RepID=UPI0033D174E6
MDIGALPPESARSPATSRTSNTLAFSPSAPLLASAGEDTRIILWDPTRLPLAEHTDWLNDVGFAPDGRTLATAGDDGAIILWNADSRTVRGQLTAGPAPVNTIAFSPDGRSIVAVAGTPQQHMRIGDPALLLFRPADRRPPYGCSDTWAWSATSPSALTGDCRPPPATTGPPSSGTPTRDLRPPRSAPLSRMTSA